MGWQLDRLFLQEHYTSKILIVYNYIYKSYFIDVLLPIVRKYFAFPNDILS